MQPFHYYLIAVTAIGFLVYLLNMWLYDHSERWTVDSLLTVVAVLGGTAGILLAIMLFDRKSVKENMMSRVFALCLLVIQVIAVLMFRGYRAERLTFAFWEFFARHRWLLVYLAVINIITFAIYAIDKINAVRQRGRVRIVSLLSLAFIGGSIGAWLAIYLLRHKTRKDYFTVGVPLMLAMQAMVLFYAMNFR